VIEVLDRQSPPVHARGIFFRHLIAPLRSATIDPTNPTNLAKFISGSAPVGTATAVAAFGTPDFLFKDGVSTFTTNAGTGGTVTASGTVTDYAPGP
jgi:hypothetical protein